MCPLPKDPSCAPNDPLCPPKRPKVLTIASYHREAGFVVTISYQTGQEHNQLEKYVHLQFIRICVPGLKLSRKSTTKRSLSISDDQLRADIEIQGAGKDLEIRSEIQWPQEHLHFPRLHCLQMMAFINTPGVHQMSQQWQHPALVNQWISIRQASTEVFKRWQHLLSTDLLLQHGQSYCTPRAFQCGKSFCRPILAWQ